MKRIGTWIAASAVGEAVGLTASGAIAAVVAPMLMPAEGGPDPRAMRALMIAAGALEGAVLGGAQALALRRLGSRVPAGPWAIATSIGMAVGWGIGTVLGDAEGQEGEMPGLAALAVYAAVSGLAIGVAVGAAQGFVLRRADAHRAGFRVATALGWTAAMLVSFVGAGLLPVGEYDLGALALGLVTGGVMGAVVGAATGRPLLAGASG